MGNRSHDAHGAVGSEGSDKTRRTGNDRLYRLDKQMVLHPLTTATTLPKPGVTVYVARHRGGSASHATRAYRKSMRE